MACCKPAADPEDPSLDGSVESNVSYCRMFRETFGRDFSALINLIKAKMKLKKYLKNNDTIPTLYDQIAAKYPHKAALVLVDGKSWSFLEVNTYANALANYMLTQGYKPGDVVALYMENIPEFAIFWLGLAKIGVIASLINYNLKGHSLIHCLEVSEAKGIIYSGEFAGVLHALKSDLPRGMRAYCYGVYDSSLFEAVHVNDAIKLCPKTTPPKPPNTSLKDTLFHIYTSGTTGLPKAAVITHTRFFWSSFMPGLFVGLTSDSVIYDTLPLYHSSGGILGLGMCYMLGATIVMRKKFSASHFWEDCSKYKCTDIQYIGEMCRYLLMQPERPTDKQHKVQCMYGNGLKQQIWPEFVSRFNVKNVKEFYGATEGNCNIINTTNKLGAVGFCILIAPKAYPITLIRVDQETGDPERDSKGVCIKCKPGQLGEMVGKIVSTDPTRGFDGYLNQGANNSKIVHDVFVKGDMAFRTGDLMVMDGYGYCYFRDRTGDTFRWKGENVSTSEVEAIISNIVKLSDSVVYGVEIAGIEGKAGMAAIVDHDDSVDMNELYTEFDTALPHYARPVFIRLLKSSQADITSTYKLQKTTYRSQGFNPSNMGGDALYYMDGKHGGYKPLTDTLYQEIQEQKIRF